VTFSLSPEPGAAPGDTRTAARSRVMRDGQDTGLLLPGLWLEAQFMVGSDALLFITHNVPYEEQLDLCLISAGNVLKDRLSLAWIYSTGIFSDARVVGKRSIVFSFFADAFWRVDVLPTPGWRLPLVSEPRGVWRRFGFKRRMVITRLPGMVSSSSPEGP